MTASEHDISAVEGQGASEPAPEQVAPAASQSETTTPVDPAVLALCKPISDSDPCGPDLDAEGDIDYLNFLAGAEGVLPTSFFSQEDGRPFDRSLIDFDGQMTTLRPLLARTADLRLLILRARLLILNRDLSGFATSLAAAAEWLEKYWDQVHPRPQDGNLTLRENVLSTLDLPTVVFPVQYAPLFEVRRVGQVNYRALMIASNEAKPREGEVQHSVAAINEALTEAPAEMLAAARKNVATIRTALNRIKNAFAMQGESVGLKTLPPLVDKIAKFIDPAGAVIEGVGEADEAAKKVALAGAAGPGLASVAHARAALAAVAHYYSTSEPSSPILPLVRQAHELIGKSFFDVMSALMPAQVETAMFQIGGDTAFDLPVGRLSGFSEVTPVESPPEGSDGAADPPAYAVTSRAQAVGLLDQVQRFYRQSEPSSPIPMLCERARALAERDFMGVLREVLPKTAFKLPETGG
jgi:type VI secretion system protein ImpA